MSMLLYLHSSPLRKKISVTGTLQEQRSGSNTPQMLCRHSVSVSVKTGRRRCSTRRRSGWPDCCSPCQQPLGAEKHAAQRAGKERASNPV